nr:MAG TPA: hypothetical protein [Caudoviricetes sp.]DAM33811.1 MAG TPA: hypothetical protein [Caudoviricetes sp.]DAX63418.1 MAG TPA: hypothetical protein [Caudoviricetes sp.]
MCHPSLICAILFYLEGFRSPFLYLDYIIA